MRHLKNTKLTPTLMGISRVSNSDSDHPVSIGLPEGALRDLDGKLNLDEAKKVSYLERLTDFNVYTIVQGHTCDLDDLYLANRAQKEAIQAISYKQMELAKQNLIVSEKHCSDIGKISLHFYLKALVEIEVGNIEESKALIKNFLDYASAVEPAGFFSDDYGTEKSHTYQAHSHQEFELLEQELTFYRKQATSFLKGETSQLPLTERTAHNITAKMYPNNLFRPGGSKDSEFQFALPVFGYSSILGSLWGVRFIKAWDRFLFSPNFLVSTQAGSLYGGSLHYSLFESPDRDLNVNLMLLANSWKRLSYHLDIFGFPEKVQVSDEGLNYGVGFGVTKRFILPSLGISAEGILEQDTLYNSLNTYGTLYGFYDIAPEFDIFTGFLRNNPVIGFGLSVMRIGYNLKEQSIVTYFNSASF